MKKIQKTLVKVKKIIVNCEQNDSVDMRCGGPPVLGFDFYIDADKNIDKMINFIKSELKENCLPLMSICTEKDAIEEKYLWTKDKISECIKKGY